MFKIIDRYILKGYVPLLVMSSLVCWFIVLMQFLWRYVDELVGKGLSVWVIAQTIFYAAMTCIPLALPLGILLGSLIFFGNLGERLELLSMKASGISLYRIMRPMFATILSVALGLFLFQNTLMITSQVKMWTLLLSARYASPELEIPEGVFYNGIPDYSIYVSKRDKKHKGRMHGIMVYDYKRGSENVRILRADSGRIVMNEDKLFLSWRLYNGQSFENLRQPQGYLDAKPIPYAKERFVYKEIVIPFDTNFQKMDDNEVGSLYVGKNLSQLNLAIDTARMEIDSIRREAGALLTSRSQSGRYSYQMPSLLDTTKQAMQLREELLGDAQVSSKYSLDTVVGTIYMSDSLTIARNAYSQLKGMHAEIQSKHYLDEAAYKKLRTNNQEWHRKFTFPAACIIFFFIGAPLGAIIRKGGIGLPVIVSVVFFIIYYIIDTLGHNLVSSEKLPVWLGMWISSIVLIPVGIFLTISATRDSASLNLDAYILFFKRLWGAKGVRKLNIKDIVVEEADYSEALSVLATLEEESRRIDTRVCSAPLWQVWISPADQHDLMQFAQKVELLVKDLSETKSTMLAVKLTELPIIPERLLGFVPTSSRQGLLLGLLLPLSLPYALILRARRKSLGEDLRATLKAIEDIRPIVRQLSEEQASDSLPMPR